MEKAHFNILYTNEEDAERAIANAV